LASEPPSLSAFDFAARVARAYASLTQLPLANPETVLAGRFFYAGELDDPGRALVVAANIAGAATLAATADRAAQKQALRDGIVDFPVTSLDESLRILKNQLRKRETVAVCVALGPAAVEREMIERGVAPDLLRGGLSIAPRHQSLLAQEDGETEVDLKKIPALVTWRIGSPLPKELAKLDEIALACLDEDEWAARRWVRFAPRYLGRLAQGLRPLETHREFAQRFAGRVQRSVEHGEIGVAVEIQSHHHGLREEYCFVPVKQ
jgi:urocanate hydratase